MAPDLAVSFGFVARPVGRPRSAAQRLKDLEPALTAFDHEMAALDEVLVKLGVLKLADDAALSIDAQA